jgi:hypothetical protein
MPTLSSAWVKDSLTPCGLTLTLPRRKPTPLLASAKSTPVAGTTGSPRATRVRVVEGHGAEENQRKAKEKEAVQDADWDIENSVSTSGADTG